MPGINLEPVYKEYVSGFKELFIHLRLGMLFISESISQALTHQLGPQVSCTPVTFTLF